MNKSSIEIKYIRFEVQCMAWLQKINEEYDVSLLLLLSTSHMSIAGTFNMPTLYQ